mgnify:CR=1 FL=1|tara:strand:- start:449 stop:778 length:330 start_codon:yes stop_codon:yes gene_type:complete
MNFILTKYTNIDNNTSLQLDMSFKNNGINIINIKNALKIVNNRNGDYVLKYSYNNNILEVYLLETNNWVKEYNMNNTLAYINIYNLSKSIYMSIKSKSQSGYNNFLKVL